MVADGTAAKILKDPSTQWGSFESLSGRFRFDQVWTDLGEDRLAVNRIHPCPKGFYHPHPWPFAVILLQNSYRMAIGYGEQSPRISMNIEVAAGSSYEMVDPYGWHDVVPIEGPVVSLMLRGPFWPPNTPSTKVLPPLSVSTRDELLALAATQLEGRLKV